MSSNSRDGFVFYRSFYNAISDLDNDDKLQIYDAIAQYALDKVEPPLSGFVKTIFKLIKPQLDANWKKYDNGCKGAKYGKDGGAPKGNQNAIKTTPEVEQNNPKTRGKEKDKVKYKEKENDNMLPKTSSRFSPPELNEVAKFISDNNYQVDAERFINFYQSKGWLVGNSKMKDWKAAVRTWNSKEKSCAKKESFSATATSTATAATRDYEETF